MLLQAKYIIRRIISLGNGEQGLAEIWDDYNSTYLPSGLSEYHAVNILKDYFLNNEDVPDRENIVILKTYYLTI